MPLTSTRRPASLNHDHDSVCRSAGEKRSPPGDLRSRALKFLKAQPIPNPAVRTGFFVGPVSGSIQRRRRTMSDLREQLRGLWLPLVTPFRDGELDETSLRRLVRHYASRPVDGFILAATSGEGMSLGMSELERLVCDHERRDFRKPALHPDLPRPVGREHAQDARCAGRDGGLADRRLSDREPLLHAAVAARAARALHRARRPCFMADRALQHPLSLRGRHRQRHDAAACRASQHRRPEGLLRRAASSRSTCCGGGLPASAC